MTNRINVTYCMDYQAHAFNIPTYLFWGSGFYLKELVFMLKITWYLRCQIGKWNDTNPFDFIIPSCDCVNIERTSEIRSSGLFFFSMFWWELLNPREIISPFNWISLVDFIVAIVPFLLWFHASVEVLSDNNIGFPFHQEYCKPTANNTCQPISILVPVSIHIFLGNKVKRRKLWWELTVFESE